MRWMLIIMLMWTLSAQAASQAHGPSPIFYCENVFRQAYLESTRQRRPGPDLVAAQVIFSIYFDFINGLNDVYFSARSLFAALRTPEGNEQRVLAVLAGQMRAGKLCEGGRPKSFAQIVESLRPEVL